MQDLNYLNTPLTLLSLAHGTLQTHEPIRGDEILSPVGLLFTHTCTLKHTQIQKGRLMPLMKAVKILIHALILNTPLLAEGLSMNTRWELG